MIPESGSTCGHGVMTRYVRNGTPVTTLCVRVRGQRRGPTQGNYGRSVDPDVIGTRVGVILVAWLGVPESQAPTCGPWRQFMARTSSGISGIGLMSVARSDHMQPIISRPDVSRSLLLSQPARYNVHRRPPRRGPYTSRGRLSATQFMPHGCATTHKLLYAMWSGANDD